MKNFSLFKYAYWGSLFLSIIGAVNWGLIGLFDLNLVSLLFGEQSILTNTIYVIVGISGTYLLVHSLKNLS